MTSLSKYKRFLIVMVAAFALLLAACGSAVQEAQEQEPAVDQAAEEPAAEETMFDYASLEGDVLADGSSTVFPLSAAVAEEFRTVSSGVNVSVGLSGTGGGFKKFCPGETDLSNASRPIKDDEKTLCADNNVEWSEYLVALDGLTVMVHPENDWVECLSAEDLALILGVNSEVVTWADINPDWPAEEILFFIPDPDSGTRDYMIEVIEAEIESETDLRQDAYTTVASDDNVLLTGISGEINAIGFFGYAYYQENPDAVRAVPIENSDGDCLLPSNETVQDETYNPLSRPLYVYANNQSIVEKPWVAAFLHYYLSEGAYEVMDDVGYSLPPEGTYEAGLVTLEEILGQ